MRTELVEKIAYSINKDPLRNMQADAYRANLSEQEKKLLYMLCQIRACSQIGKIDL